jgi:hypothetical protein
VTEGIGMLQPRPKGQFPDPELYTSLSMGEKPGLACEVNTRTVSWAVPDGAMVSFSSIPVIAQPPLGAKWRGAAWFLPLRPPGWR